jgi:cytochrome c oxidase cbb3-type subunit 3
MTIRSVLSTIGVSLIATPIFAQASSEPSLWDGPNAALAIVAVVQLIAILAIAGIIKRMAANSDYFIKIYKMKSSGETKAVGLFLALSFAASVANAQSTEAALPKYSEFFSDPNTVMLLVLNILLLGAFIYMTTLLKRTISMLMPTPEPSAAEVEAQSTPESKFLHVLTDAVPVEREHEVLTDHEYDGIRELDNNLPPWWVAMFYVTIIFAFVYLIYYHVLPYGESQEEQYLAEVEQAEADKAAYLAQAKNLVDENTVTLLTAEADLAAGKAIFNANCQQCHAADGGGGVGPNFTDNYWIHGGSISDIFKTVKYGVPQKGMIAWEAQLRPVEMAQVASYIKTLVGTTAANPKEPQGELYVEPSGEGEAAPSDTTATDIEPEMEEPSTEEGDLENATAYK